MTFVSQWLADEIELYIKEHGLPVGRKEIRKCNRHFYFKYPEISKQTLRRATLAVRNKDYRTYTTTNHNTAVRAKSLIPTRYYRRAEYFQRVAELLLSCQKDQRRVRLVNAQDLHYEKADPGVVDILLQVLDTFKPDYVPQMCDIVDNSLFAPRRHGSSYFQNSLELPDGVSDSSSISNAMLSFEQIILEYADLIDQVAPNCIKPVWLGNHEAWLLQYLHDSPETSGYFIEKFMAAIQEKDILWTEPERFRELPITDNVIAIHGWLSRSSYHGATAMGYQRYYGDKMSVFAGHSHRQETVWGKPHYNTGGMNFVNITGTLGETRAAYNQYAYSGHNLGFSLAYLAPSGNVGHEIHDIHIHRKGDFYECYALGKKYRAKACNPVEFVNPLLGLDLKNNP